MRFLIKFIVVSLSLCYPSLWILAKPISSSKIVLIHATDRDEKKLDVFPWPRSAHADLIEKLEASGAKWIVLKYIFDAPRPDRGDDKLINVCRKYGNIIVPSACAIAQSGQKGDLSVMKLSVVENKSKNTNFMNFTNCAYPFSTLAEVSAGVGSIDCKSENGQLLDIPLITQIEGKLYPSLPLITVAKILGYSTKNMIVYDKKLALGNKSLKMNHEGMMNLKLSVPGKLYKTHDYTDILDGKYDIENIRESIVVIGYGGNRYPSDFITSVSKKHNGTDINADAIRNLLIEMGIQK